MRHSNKTILRALALGGVVAAVSAAALGNLAILLNMATSTWLSTTASSWYWADPGKEYSYNGQISTQQLIDQCKLTSVHKERGWNHGGATTLTAQQNVPFFLNSAEPSWTSRQLWDYRWSWWFGDKTTVVKGHEDASAIRHTYKALGTYQVFNMIFVDDTVYIFGYDSDGSPIPAYVDTNNGPPGNKYYVHSCNYISVNVVPNRAPIAKPAVDAEEKIAGEMFQFMAASVEPDGNPMTHSWVFSDGTTSSAKNPLKFFGNATMEPIVRTATLTSSDGDKSSSASISVIVLPRETCGGSTGIICD